MKPLFRCALAPAALLAVAACQAPQSYDYTLWLDHPPRSILVLPPVDETVTVDACYGSFSTVTEPLVEHGFYVFPIAVVDAMMRDNGLPTADEMHQVSMEKLREVFDPDAVLYLTVSDWGTSYAVLTSETRVTMSGVLVDAATGEVLWRGSSTTARGSGDGGGGVGGALAAALLNQVATSISDPSRELARQTSWKLFTTPGTGFLPGPYDPESEATLAVERERLADEKSGAKGGEGSPVTSGD